MALLRGTKKRTFVLETAVKMTSSMKTSRRGPTVITRVTSFRAPKPRRRKLPPEQPATTAPSDSPPQPPADALDPSAPLSDCNPAKKRNVG